jgi:DNA-binding GntR family transcriptional regulator
MAMLETDKTARYLQIVAVLQARITSGLYAVGSLMPTEADLCTEFAVSRYTVREALRRLMAMGLISRRQGSGTVVVRTEVSGGYSFSLRSLSELFQYAMDTHYRIIGIDEATIGSREAAQVGGKRGSRWTIITGLRSTSADAPPFCYTKSYVPQRLAWVAPELPGCVGPFFAYMEKRANEPILSAEQEIRAERMSPDIARALGCSQQTIALLMLRRYVSDKGTIVASFNWHIASEFTYRMALQRDELPRPS